MRKRKAEYDVAQVCPNGHVSNPYTTMAPEHNQTYCDKCGEKTMLNCPACNEPIRGGHSSAGFLKYIPPACCGNCGKPFPWTLAKLEAAHELANELTQISDEEKASLKNSIDELVTDSPKTPVAAKRFKRFMETAAREVAPVFQEILVDVVSDTAKRMLWG